jgi:hypothetical protein
MPKEGSVILISERKKVLTLFAGVIILLTLSYFTNYSIRIKSVIFLIIFISFILLRENFTFNLKKIQNIGDLGIGIFLFILLIILQNRLLNYEIISMDVPSYLVASQDITLNNLPFENQWESKGPVFLYFYKLLMILSFKNLAIFKILNDVLLFVISFMLYKTSLLISKNNLIAVSSAVFFILVTSYEWYVTELSEIYCLFFISIQYYIITKYELTKNVIFISATLIALSSLINQATAIFMIGLLISIFINHKNYQLSSSITYVITGFLLPHIIFISIYFLNGLIKVYLTNYIKIPFGYVSSGRFEIYELIVWLRRYFQYSEFLYYAIIAIGIMFLVNCISYKKSHKKNHFVNNLIYLSLGFSIYVIAGHNYQHHLFYSIFFISIFISQLKSDISTASIFLLILISGVQIMSFSIQPSLKNIKSPSDTQQNYPLRQLADEINLIFKDKEYDVLAVDHVLLLYYLEKENSNYIVHPYNNFEKYIVDALLDIDLLKTNENNHLSYYIELEPDMIICAPQTIIAGTPTKLGSDIFNCEITDYKKNYYKLDTEKYLINPNREYYYDPYISIDVFIKNS